jgi:glycosyltransferase involved in cell wall biosynthesis
VLFVGHLRHEKNTDVLLRAFARLREELPDATLRLVGPPHESLENVWPGQSERLAAMEQEGIVTFAGAAVLGPALYAEYAAADVLVLPSGSEGTPRVLIEARACGCPVVASDVGGIPDSVEDGVDGLLFPVGDHERLADLLLQLANDPKRRRILSSRGLSRARELTLEVFAGQLEQELRRAARYRWSRQRVGGR